MMLQYRCNDNAEPADVTFLVTCRLNESTGELYWDGAENLPVCIENIG